MNEFLRHTLRKPDKLLVLPVGSLAAPANKPSNGNQKSKIIVNSTALGNYFVLQSFLMISAAFSAKP